MTGEVLTAVLAGIVALALAAKKLKVPYPVVFVLGGLLVSVIPGIPTITLQPNLVFLLFLPPLIFGDGWTTDYQSFKRYQRPIYMLAIGLVVMTSAAVALFTHWMIGIPLAVGFVLGGILSPTDAVATDAIDEEMHLPRQLAAIISGESLVNDASGLVIYRFGIIAVATGTFSLVAALGQFAYAVIAGVAIGLAGGWLIVQLSAWIRKQGLSDERIAVSISLVTPFALYVPADLIGASGVLAVLSGGIFMSRHSSRIFNAEERIAASSVWNLLFFTFNGAAFLLIGLQLHAIVRALPEYSLLTLIGWGLAVSALLVVVRFAWCFAATYGSRRLFPRIREREGPAPPWQAVFVLSYAGMRGIVSLAAALAVPETIAGGAPFPERPLILFITFVVILVTLVGEGLTLPLVIRSLGQAVRADPAEAQRLVAHARVATAEAARERLRTLEVSFESTLEWEVAGRLQAAYELRLTESSAEMEGAGDHRWQGTERRLRLEAYAAERRALLELRRTGAITDEVFRELERSIDLAESRYA